MNKSENYLKKLSEKARSRNKIKKDDLRQLIKIYEDHKTEKQFQLRILNIFGFLYKMPEVNDYCRDIINFTDPKEHKNIKFGNTGIESIARYLVHFPENLDFFIKNYLYHKKPIIRKWSLFVLFFMRMAPGINNKLREKQLERAKKILIEFEKKERNKELQKMTKDFMERCW